MSGQVYIFIPKSNEEILDEYQNKRLTTFKHSEFCSETENEKLEKILMKNNDRKLMYIKKGVITYKKVATLGPGSFFGEIALILDKPRTATVVTAMKLDVISLNKKNYEKIFIESIEQSHEKINFFKKKLPHVSPNFKRNFINLKRSFTMKIKKQMNYVLLFQVKFMFSKQFFLQNQIK